MYNTQLIISSSEKSCLKLKKKSSLNMNEFQHM